MVKVPVRVFPEGSVSGHDGSPGTFSGSCPAWKSLASRELSLTFHDVTALGLICAAPTLLRGRVAAAYAPPPSATNRAKDAITFAEVARGLIDPSLVERSCGCRPIRRPPPSYRP